MFSSQPRSLGLYIYDIFYTSIIAIHRINNQSPKSQNDTTSICLEKNKKGLLSFAHVNTKYAKIRLIENYQYKTINHLRMRETEIIKLYGKFGCINNKLPCTKNTLSNQLKCSNCDKTVGSQYMDSHLVTKYCMNYKKICYDYVYISHDST